MRDKLIEIIGKFCGGLPVNDITPPYGYENLANHLIANGVVVGDKPTPTAEPLTNCQQWIPVTERLPGREGRYLVVKRIGKSGSVYVQIMNGDSYGFSMEHIYTDDVTHWMPLPEPPKEVEE